MDDKLTLWLTHMKSSFIDESYYIDQTDEEINNCFTGALDFGTAGIRGEIGIGPNRLNEFTVRRIAHSVARYLNDSSLHKTAVIMYDTRLFSEEFSNTIATVLSSYQIHTFIFDTYHTTPELSYAVRYLNASIGFMITASHNPKEYNGIKVYNHTGGQILDEQAHSIKSIYDQLNEDELFNQSIEANESFIDVLTDEVSSSYDHKVVSQYHSMADFNVKTVFTSLHGTSLPRVKSILSTLNYDHLFVLEDQSSADGTFPNATSLNPEDPNAFKDAIKYAQKLNAHLVIATDPDSDRLGVVVYHKGTYRHLTGNQLGVILLKHIIDNTSHLEQRTVIKSIVTSDLAKVICKAHDVEIKDVLTGFKYIGEYIEEISKDEQQNFIFGYEESHGYLTSSLVRDKDAIQVIPMLIELADTLNQEDKTLIDYLENINNHYCHSSEKLYSLTLQRFEGAEKIQKLMNYYRHQPIEQIAGLEIISKEDFMLQQQFDPNGHELGTLKLPPANVIKFNLRNGWIVIRPSGTEPKVKLYISILEQCDEQLFSNIYDDLFGMID